MATRNLRIFPIPQDQYILQLQCTYSHNKIKAALPAPPGGQALVQGVCDPFEGIREPEGMKGHVLRLIRDLREDPTSHKGLQLYRVPLKVPARVQPRL